MVLKSIVKKQLCCMQHINTLKTYNFRDVYKIMVLTLTRKQLRCTHSLKCAITTMSNYSIRCGGALPFKSKFSAASKCDGGGGGAPQLFDSNVVVACN